MILGYVVRRFEVSNFMCIYPAKFSFKLLHFSSTLITKMSYIALTVV